MICWRQDEGEGSGERGGNTLYGPVPAYDGAGLFPCGAARARGAVRPLLQELSQLRHAPGGILRQRRAGVAPRLDGRGTVQERGYRISARAAESRRQEGL